MAHREVKRICLSAGKAVLFVHGIVGTPEHFSFLLPFVPEKMSVWSLLLDGHGGSVRDFSRSSMKKWQAQVDAAVAELAETHDEIYIVAHSMGTLLTMEAAIREPKIKKLFFLAVPLKLFLRARMLKNMWKVYFDKIAPEDVEAISAKRCYGIENDKNIFRYFAWLPRYLELFSKMRKGRHMLSELNTTCFAFHSARDEMVSAKTVKYLRQSPCILTTLLADSGHYHYAERDLGLIIDEFKIFISEGEDGYVG